MVPAAYATDVDNMPAARAEFARGRKLYAAKDFKAAQASYERAAALGSRDATIQYYLALAAAQNKDAPTFQRALARVLVTFHPKRGIGMEAKNLLNRNLPGSEPYACVSGATGNLSRFIKADMPIKVFISSGLMLPPPYRGREGLRPAEMAALLNLIKQPTFYRSLQKVPDFEASFAFAVQNGLQQWDWARQEGILNYQIVTQPTNADIVVLWCPQLERRHTAFTEAMNVSNIGKKVIMQIATGDKNKCNSWFLPWVTAHEFGHAFGVSAHSPNDKDLMSANANLTQPHGKFSENDKLTIRALYDLAPTVRR